MLTQPPSSRLKVVVLASGSGTLLQALLDDAVDPQAPYDLVAVGSDVPGAAALDRATTAGVPTFVVRTADHTTRAEWDAELSRVLTSHQPDLIVLAGFMKLVGPAVLAAHADRIVNSHPSLLPSFPGMKAPADALAHGVKITGCTIFTVDAGVDTGAILAQHAVPVESDDTVDTLHERIKVAERALLVSVVRELALPIHRKRT